MRKKPDNTDYLTVIELVEYRNYVDYWLCQCVCGTEKLINGYHLRSGKIRSCGCQSGRLRVWHRYHPQPKPKLGGLDELIANWPILYERVKRIPPEQRDDALQQAALEVLQGKGNCETIRLRRSGGLPTDKAIDWRYGSDQLAYKVATGYIHDETKYSQDFH